MIMCESIECVFLGWPLRGLDRLTAVLVAVNTIARLLVAINRLTAVVTVSNSAQNAVSRLQLRTYQETTDYFLNLDFPCGAAINETG